MGTSGKQVSPGSSAAWIRLVRIPFLTGTVIPVVLGTVIAWTLSGIFVPLYFVMALAGAVCLHLGTNVVNDYFDFRSGCDAINADAISPISGGSRVLLESLVKPQSAHFAALLLFGVATTIGLVLSVMTGWTVFLIGIIGLVSGYFYVSQLATRGVGELFVGLNFGPLMVLGSYYVQARSLALEPLIASVPVGILIGAILWINEIPDYTADKTVGKKTLVVRVGRKRAADIYGILVLSAYAWTVAMVALKQMPIASLIVLATLPLTLKGINVARRQYENPRDMIPANLATIKLHMFFGVLLTGAYLLQYAMSFFI